MAGLRAQGVSSSALIAADRSAAARVLVARRLDIRVVADNTAVIRAADVIVLAVKPQQMSELLAQVGPHLQRRQLVVSIAAGITLRWLQARLRRSPVIRVMPNLPATVGYGYAAVVAGRLASRRHMAIARSLFQAVGAVDELPERCFDAITAVSGSGPAYVLFLAGAWERAAAALGLPAQVRRRAIEQTLAGSARLFAAGDLSAEELIRRVASKRGATEAALKVLGRRQVAAHIVEALRAAARRSRQLSWM
jgi:pyrroline-5-carboxylate reductase